MRNEKSRNRKTHTSSGSLQLFWLAASCQLLVHFTYSGIHPATIAYRTPAVLLHFSTILTPPRITHIMPLAYCSVRLANHVIEINRYFHRCSVKGIDKARDNTNKVKFYFVY